ncbi:unnamed protein product, partial [Vitis vinifera]
MSLYKITPNFIPFKPFIHHYEIEFFSELHNRLLRLLSRGCQWQQWCLKCWSRHCAQSIRRS